MEFLHESKPNILIVDDDILIAESNKFTIRKAGYNVVGIAVDSAQALALTKEKKPDLILMDVNLAGSDDGIVTAEEIQKIDDIPIIFVTAYSDAATIERAKKIAPFAYLIKPFDNRELIVAIETTLNKHSFDKKIKEQKLLFETVANFAYEWEFWISPDLKFKYCSPSCQKITGYKAEEFLANPMLLLDIIHPVDKKKYEEHFKDYIKQKSNQTAEVLEFRIINKQGEVKYIRHTCNSISDENNNYLGRRVTNSDITENKKIENLWRQSEKDYKRIFNNAHDAILILDPQNENVLEANSTALEIYGYKREEFIGISMRTFSKNPEIGDEKIKQVIKEGKVENFVTAQFRKDGSEIIMEVNGSLIEYKGKEAILSMNHDITERIKAEIKLKKNEEFLTRLINNIGEIIYSVSFAENSGKPIVDFVSKQANWILGYAPDEFIRDPKFWFKIIHPDDAQVVEEKTKLMFDEKKSGVLIYRMQHNLTGEFIWIEDHRQLLVDENGSIIGLFGAAHNITERIKAEESLRQSEEKFKNLFDNSPSSIAIYKAVDDGKDFIFTDFNLTAEKTDKIKREEVIGKRISEMFPAADSLGFLEVFRKVWSTGNTLYIKPSFYNDQRIKGWRENIIYKLDTGEIVAIYNDVTERMEAEIALRQSEEKFRSIFENHSAVKLLVDPEDGKLIDANLAAVIYYGYTKDELKQMYISQLNILPPEEIKKEMENVRMFKKNRLEFMHRLKNGDIRNVEVYSSKIEIEGKDYLHSIIHDITEKVEMEKELNNYREHLEKLVENRTEEIDKLNEDLLE